MSAYRTAIDHTTRAIVRRSRYFRNQIVTVVVVSLVSIAWALIARSPAPLLGVALLVPVSGIFFLADSRVLDGWRAELLEGWTAHGLDLAAFSAAIRANPTLPKETTEGMLATLPLAGDIVEEQRMSTATRHAIAAKALAKYRSASDALAVKVAACAVAVGALIAAAATRRWEPLLGVMSLLSVPIAGGWMRRARLAKSEQEVTACRDQAGFSEPDYARLVAALK
jgi:hypothetical protein